MQEMDNRKKWLKYAVCWEMKEENRHETHGGGAKKVKKFKKPVDN